MLSHLVALVAGTPLPVVVGLAVLVLGVESGSPYGLCIPGTTVAAGLGVWSALGEHPTSVCMAAAAAGTVAGAHVGWWRGRGGATLPAPVARSARAAAAVARARRRVGGRSGPGASTLVAAGHWATVLRPLLPRVAAAAGVRYCWVGPALTVSGGTWAATLVGLGAWVGPHAATVVPWAGALVVVVVVGAPLVRARIGPPRRRSTTAPRRSTSAQVPTARTG